MHASSSSNTPILLNYPPVIGYDGLSQLLCRSVATLQADKCRHPESLPPCCTPPGTRNPLWLIADVINWLEKYRQPATPPKNDTEPPRRRGAPTKSERLAKITKEGGGK